MPSSSSEQPGPAELRARGARLGTRRLGRPLHVLAETVSTNDELARLARAGAEHGTAVVADAQTGGRGRQGRSWSSPPGSGLYLSVLLRPPLPPARAPGLVFAAAVATVETADALIAGAGGVRPGLRWPNDVVVLGLPGAAGRPRKLAGILVEAQVRGTVLERVIVGIGVNVRRRPWPPELAGLAVALEELAGRPVDRAELGARLLERLEHWSDALVAGGPAGLMARWRSWAVGLSGEAVIRRGAPAAAGPGTDDLSGIIEEVDDEGTLYLRTAAGERVAVVAGDVELVPMTPA